MRKSFVLFLIFSIVSLILILSVQASPDTESLYVDGFNSVLEEWDETGVSPWLNDNTANYISTSVDEEWHEEFTFTNGYGSGTINSVTFYVEINGPSARNDKAEFYIYNGTWNLVLSQDPDGDAYVWYNVDVSTELNTWAKIDGAKLKVQYQRAGSPSTQTIYVRRAYLYVDYSVGGIDYVADLSQSISSTWNILAKTDYNIIPSQSLSTSWNILTEWDAIIDLSQAITSSWETVLSHGMFVELSQSIATSWDILMQWNAILDVNQAISTTWEVLIRSTFNIIPDFSVATSWIVDVVQTLAGGIDYIVDLSQSVSTTWTTVTQSIFNINPSLSLTTSWLVDIYKGVQYSIDLTVDITTSWIIEILQTTTEAGDGGTTGGGPSRPNPEEPWLPVYAPNIIFFMREFVANLTYFAFGTRDRRVVTVAFFLLLVGLIMVAKHERKGKRVRKYWNGGFKY